MSLTWSDVAESDLDDLYDYIARDVPCDTPSHLTGGEAETGKGPVDLFPAERVRELSVHPGQERDGGEMPVMRYAFCPTAAGISRDKPRSRGRLGKISTYVTPQF